MDLNGNPEIKKSNQCINSRVYQGVKLHSNYCKAQMCLGIQDTTWLGDDSVNNSDSLGRNSACLQVVNRKKKSKVEPVVLAGTKTECRSEHVHTQKSTQGC